VERAAKIAARFYCQKLATALGKVMKKVLKMRILLLRFVRFSFIMNKTVFRREMRVGELIAVLSGKGGTGKTSLCAGIATALAEQGLKILCIDCDIGLRNLDISLGLTDMSTLSFREVCGGDYSLEQSTVHPQFPGLRFLTAPMNCDAEAIDRSAVGDMLRKARETFDYVFLDAPAGIDAGFQLCAFFADRLILVTGSDPASIRDAARTGEVLELMGKGNIRLVVNRVHPKLFDRMGITVDDVMDRAGLPLLGIVPEDPNVILAAAEHKPLLKLGKKGAAGACRRIAKRIQGQPVSISIR